MKITKSELKEMIRECLREELNRANLKEGAFKGEMAGDNSIGGNTGPRSTYATGEHHNATGYLKRLSDKNDIKTMTVKVNELEPGMITDVGQISKIEDMGYKEVKLWYTNGVDERYSLNSDILVLADLEDTSKPSTRSYSELKQMGLKEAINEDATPSTMSWEDTIGAADQFLDELIIKSGNPDYDDGDGYWAEEEGHVWCNRYLYYASSLNNVANLERLCDEYSTKVPNVEFYYFDDDSFEDPVSEIGDNATNPDYEEDL
jgi:hypothetical protein